MMLGSKLFFTRCLRFVFCEMVANAIGSVHVRRDRITLRVSLIETRFVQSFFYDHHCLPALLPIDPPTPRPHGRFRRPR